MSMSNTITPVWYYNFWPEIDRLRSSLKRFKLLSVDTEFPGFLRDTPRDASDDTVYDDLKFNVNNTNLIQLGVTLMDDNGNIGPTWEFNLKFDMEKESHVQSSIDFLKKNGIDFERMKKEGIHKNLFLLNFLRIVGVHQDLKWVTFHGIYDLAHVLKLFTQEPLPDTAQEFADKASSYFDNVFDLKMAAKYCDDLKEVQVGLAKLSRILNVKRFGEAHNAGSDSLLTAHVYAKMMENYNIGDGSLEGILYGLEDVRIGRMYKTYFMIPHPVPMPCAAYAMPQIPVNWHDIPSMQPQPQPYYFPMQSPMIMPVPETYVMLY
ncbi:hypothetical protein ACOSP7_031059 [Xanthoceras sorbifolium]